MKCLALFSGGLDSMLAIKIIADLGISVTALHFNIGFGGKEDKSEIMKKRANQAGGEFKLVDVRNEYLQKVLFSPKYGYGKHFNPCIDCHGFMLKTALSMLESEKAKFIITGEVVGQRPMSQRSAALNQVLSVSGDTENLILRPLCAKLLKPSVPEINGWVDREKLLDISGRGRSRQMELAKIYGFDDYETPSGGCLLTIESFAEKIRDMIKFEKIETSKDTEILKFGRHLRLENGAKMVVGKDETDNEKLRQIANEKFSEIKIPLIGACSLISKNANEADLQTAAKIALTYAKSEFGKEYEVQIDEKKFTTTPLKSKDEIKKYFIG